MKFRWPIKRWEESLVSSLFNSRTAPSRPATHSSRSLSRFSSNNRAMLPRGMRLPFGDKLAHFGGRRGRQQPLPKRPVAEHLSELREYLKVQVRGAVRHEQHEDE